MQTIDASICRLVREAGIYLAAMSGVKREGAESKIMPAVASRMSRATSGCRPRSLMEQGLPSTLE